MTSKSWSRLEEATHEVERDMDGSKGAEAETPESGGRRELCGLCWAGQLGPMLCPRERAAPFLAHRRSVPWGEEAGL